jgi:hypothetical protein
LCNQEEYEQLMAPFYAQRPEFRRLWSGFPEPCAPRLKGSFKRPGADLDENRQRPRKRARTQ